ncbi:MAG: hypothetical protein KDG55_01935 [Rhodocyclaceae bacterium]|nr:hypothetical protein [Rhodocyclaceae bacterium]
MGALIDRVDGARETGGRGVWVDGLGYARTRLLGAAAIPWQDTAACVAFFGQVDRLLRSDVQWLPVGDFYHQRVADDGDLRAAMAARSRSGFALRTMLADEAARSALSELVAALSRQSRAPVLLVLPAMAAWSVEAHALAHGEAIDAQADEGERAAMYVADALRALSQAGVGGLLLSPEGRADPHGPVLNQARHYRWDCVLADPPEGWDAHAYDLSVGPDRGQGRRLENLDTPPPEAAFYLQHLPPTAEPEPVLARLASLRSGGR